MRRRRAGAARVEGALQQSALTGSAAKEPSAADHVPRQDCALPKSLDTSVKKIVKIVVSDPGPLQTSIIRFMHVVYHLPRFRSYHWNGVRHEDCGTVSWFRLSQP